MKTVLPYSTSKIQSFSAASLECLERSPSPTACIFGNISESGRWSWVVRGYVLEVISTQSGERLAAWSFCDMIKDETMTVTAVVEYISDTGLILLIGLATGLNTGLVCVYDVKTSKVVRTIDIPYKVTSLEPIYSSDDIESPSSAISEHLQCFNGILATGTLHGYIYILDLCLDDLPEESDEECQPNQISVLDPRMSDIPHRRQDAMRRRQHLCLKLDHAVFVSCLRYIKQLGSLVVGFNFGCVQIWRLNVPVLDYSSRYDLDLYPVSHCSYQEPEDDPRSFCYLWVARGPLASEQSVDGVVSIELFQLAYNKRIWINGYGVLYEDLLTVGARFDHLLTDDQMTSEVTEDTPNSRLISCYTLENKNYHLPIKATNEESFEEGFQGPDLSLCVFVWEVTATDNSNQCFLAIFDMNRWYHTQMPMNMKHSMMSNDQCPFFAYFSLDSVVKETEPDCILASHVSWNTISKFVSSNVPTPEQHFFPSSLAFRIEFLSETGLVQTHFLGLQRQILSQLVDNGPSGLIHPNDLYHMCVYTGLLSKHLERPSANITKESIREALLTMSLEHNLVHYITSCIRQWSDEELGRAGCTMRSLLDWAWKKVSQIKTDFDKCCVPLYDCSGTDLDQQGHQFLQSYGVQLDHAVTIFNIFSQQATPDKTTSQGLEDLDTKISVLGLISQHVSTVSWFVTVKLLPELLEGYDGHGFCYPYRVIKEAFIARRQELTTLNTDIDGQNFLLIDGLVSSAPNDSIRVLWSREGGDGLYPPPSLQSLLTMHLLDGVELTTKQLIIAYLLMDMIYVHSEGYTQGRQLSEELLQQYYRTLGVRPSEARLVQGFWLLDHKKFEDAMDLLLDPLLTADLVCWKYNRIIKAFLYEGHSQMALRFMQVKKPQLLSTEDAKLHLNVLLSNGLIAQAFECQRACRDKSSFEDILSHFFLTCQQNHMMNKVLQLPMSAEEDEFLISFLQTSTQRQSADTLVMHYLQQARYVEAIRLNEKLKHSLMGETNAHFRERAATRNAIVQGYAQVLPAVQRKLAFDGPKQRTKVSHPIRRELNRPQPLSAAINQSKHGHPISRATLINAVLDKVTEVREPAEYTPFRRRHESHFEDPGPFLSISLKVPVQPRLSDMVDEIIPTPRVKSAPKHPSSPLKRPMPTSPNVFKFSPVKRKSPNRTMTAAALSLLQTPPVRRRTPPKQRPNIPSATSTPQSILKIRTAMKSSPSAKITMTEPIKHRQLQLLSSELGAMASPPQYQRKMSDRSQSQEPIPARKPDSPATPKTLRFAAVSSDPSQPVVEDMPYGADLEDIPCGADVPLRRVKDRSPTQEPTSPKLSPRIDVIHPPCDLDTLNESSTRGVNFTREATTLEVDSDIAFTLGLHHESSAAVPVNLEGLDVSDSEQDTEPTAVESSLSKSSSPHSLIVLHTNLSSQTNVSPLTPGDQPDGGGVIRDSVVPEKMDTTELERTGLKSNPSLRNTSAKRSPARSYVKPLVVDTQLVITKPDVTSPRRSPRFHSPAKQADGDGVIFKTPPYPVRVCGAITPPTSPESLKESPHRQKRAGKASPKRFDSKSESESSPISVTSEDRVSSTENTSAKDQSDTTGESDATTKVIEHTRIVMTLRSGKRTSQYFGPSLTDSPDEFTFSKPTELLKSRAPSPESSEPLHTPTQTPMDDPFVFSPPLTRSLTRSFRSTKMSDSVFSTPPVPKLTSQPETHLGPSLMESRRHSVSTSGVSQLRDGISRQDVVTPTMMRTRAAGQRSRGSVSIHNSPTDSPIGFISPVTTVNGRATRLRAKADATVNKGSGSSHTMALRTATESKKRKSYRL